MVRLFSHWFASATVLQVAFDAVLLFGGFMLAGAWLSRGDLPSGELLPTALLFAVAMIALNSTVGLYRRDPYRTPMQTAARIALWVLLAIPVAYGIFLLPPWGEVHQTALKATAVAALVGVVAVRGVLARRPRTSMLMRRVLVFGTGAEAAAVENSLRQFADSMSILGFYPVQTEANHAVA